MNNKGDTMSVKQIITQRSTFKDESFVKGPPGEGRIENSGGLVNYWEPMLQMEDVRTPHADK